MDLVYGTPLEIALFGAAALFSFGCFALMAKLKRPKGRGREDSASQAEKSNRCGVKECAALFGQVIEDCRAVSMSLCDTAEAQKKEIQTFLARIEKEKASLLDILEEAKKAEGSLSTILSESAKAIRALDEAERYAEARRMIEAGVEPSEVSKRLDMPECELALLLEMKAS